MDDVPIFGVREKSEEPKLLRVPTRMGVAELLAVAGKMNLTNALLLSQREDGTIVFLDTDMTVSEASWLLNGAQFHIMKSCSVVENPDG